MTTLYHSLFITLVHVTLVSPILFDLLYGTPRYPQCICAPPPCAAAATASATSVSGAVAVAEPAPLSRPTYAGEVPPVRPSYYDGGYPPRPPSPPMPPYPGTYPYRRRIRREAVVEPENDEQLQDCSTAEIGEIIQQSMTSSLEESRNRIRQSLLSHYGKEVIAICLPHQLHVAVTDGIEFCKKSTPEMSCHAFVF